MGMRHGRYAKLALRGAVVVALLLVGIAALFVVEHWRTQAEVGPLLSALFRDGVLHETQDSGSGHSIQIILLREAYQSDTWRARWSVFPQASLVTRSNFVLNNAVTTDIRAELQLPRGAVTIVVSRSEVERGLPGDFQRRFPNNMGYFVVSHPGFNFSKTEAILYIEHHCSGLCGGGEYILVRKVIGVWRIVAQHDTWVS
jgi:hypothetical protein